MPEPTRCMGDCGAGATEVGVPAKSGAAVNSSVRAYFFIRAVYGENPANRQPKNEKN